MRLISCFSLDILFFEAVSFSINSRTSRLCDVWYFGAFISLPRNCPKGRVKLHCIVLYCIILINLLLLMSHLCFHAPGCWAEPVSETLSLIDYYAQMWAFICNFIFLSTSIKIWAWSIWAIQGSEQQHQEVRCMKEAKENWIGEQCNETEENLRKNNVNTGIKVNGQSLRQSQASST